MAFEEMIKKALDESRNNCRLGDTLDEAIGNSKTY